MIVEAADSRVLVQTQGNIVLRVEQEPRRGWRRLVPIPVQAIARSLSWSVGLAGLGLMLAFGAHRATDESLIRSLDDLQKLQKHQDETIRVLTEQSSRNAEMVDRLSRVETAVSALPDQVDHLLVRSTSVLTKSISDLKYRPTLPAPSVSATPALESVAPAAKPRASVRLPRAKIAIGHWYARTARQ